MPVRIPHVPESGSVGDGSPSGHHFSEIGYGILVLLVLREEFDLDIIILGEPGKRILKQAVEDDVVAVLDRSPVGDELVGSDLVLLHPQAEFQADVPFHRKPVGKHVDPVLFLPESQDPGGDHHVSGEQGCCQSSACCREHVSLETEQPFQDRYHHLHQQRHRQQQADQGDIYKQAEDVQVVEAVEFQGYVGVQDDAPEGHVHESDNAGHHQQDGNGIQPHCQLRQPGVEHLSVDVVAGHEYAADAQYDQERDDEHRSERVEHLPVGIDGRGEDFRCIVDVAAPDICRGHHGEQAGQDQQEPFDGALRG